MLKPLLLLLWVATVYLLHQDWWAWKQYQPVVLGFLPLGLAYHVGYCLLASATMALLVKFAWPRHLEDKAEEDKP